MGAVAESHDDALARGFDSVGGDLELRRNAVAGDDQGVVTGDRDWVIEREEDAAAVVLDQAGFAVHEAGGADDVAAEDGADGLVAEADAELGDNGAEVANDLHGDAGFLGSAGTGRDDDMGRSEVAGIPSTVV